jgi:ubiquinone/menaquinone biosynthesis C-methylase UbiE
MPIKHCIVNCLVCLTLGLAGVAWCQQPQTAPPVVGETSERRDEQSVRPGINREFLNPALDVRQWLARFELESREIYAAREEVVAACNLRPGMRVADVGAGTGFYSRLFAAAVGADGWVYAVDIAPPFLEHIVKQADAERITNLSAVLCSQRSVRLPPESIDLAFVCDTYHHFEHPAATLASIHQALREQGQLIVIDFERVPGQSREWVLEHVRAGKAEFRAEIEAAGFEFAGQPEIKGFRENYLLRFKKKAGTGNNQ